MKVKKIAIISYHTCPLADEDKNEIGGMNVYIMQLSKSLAKKGFIIDIYTRSQDPDSSKIVDVCPNLRVIHLSAGQQKQFSKKKLIHFIPEFLVNLHAFVKEEQKEYDLISCHYYLSGLIGMQLKKTYNLPMYITFHTLGLMKNLVARGEEEREDLTRIKAEKKLVQVADKVIAISDTDAEYIQTLYDCPKDKITVLSPGVNLEYFKPKDKIKSKVKVDADPDVKLILFVGRPEPLKGIDVLLFAVKIFLEKYAKLNLCLWIVGGDVSRGQEHWSKELRKLEMLRKTLNISTSVEFLGQKRREELPDYYNAADVVVLPSHYESFGITALEAMACGTPVITTDVAGVSEIFDKRHAKLVISANNPILLAKTIKHLLKDEKFYQKVSHEVQERVKDLSWENVANKLIAIIEN